MNAPKFKLGDDWNEYRKKLDLYFEKQRTDVSRKSTILFLSVCPDTYSVLKLLCIPSKPYKVKYERLCQKLREEFATHDLESIRERVELYDDNLKEKEEEIRWLKKCEDAATSSSVDVKNPSIKPAETSSDVPTTSEVFETPNLIKTDDFTTENVSVIQPSSSSCPNIGHESSTSKTAQPCKICNDMCPDDDHTCDGRSQFCKILKKSEPKILDCMEPETSKNNVLKCTGCKFKKSLSKDFRRNRNKHNPYEN